MRYSRLAVSRIRCAQFLLAVAMSTALFFINCSDRQRINPLDPRNPATSGKMKPPTVISHRDTVMLAWPLLNFKDLTFYNLYRRRKGEFTFQQVAQLSAETSQYTETNATFDADRWYKISVQSRDYESPPSDSVHIRPGPSYVWVVNLDQGQVIKLTHDGEHIILRSSLFLQPVRVAVNPKTQSAWVIDFFSNEVVGLTSQGINSGISFFNPGAVDIAIDTVDNGFWTLSRNAGELRRYSQDGVMQLARQGFQSPRALTLDPRTRNVWVLDAGQGEIWAIDPAGNIVQKIPGFSHGRDIEIDPRTGYLWISDSTRVLKISPQDAGKQVQLKDFQYVRELAVNANNGACWFIDWSYIRDKSRVLKYDENGTLLFEKAGFTDLLGLSIDQFNGNCFVIEGQPSKLIQLNPGGKVLSSLKFDGNLIDVAVENLKP